MSFNAFVEFLAPGRDPFLCGQVLGMKEIVHETAIEARELEKSCGVRHPQPSLPARDRVRPGKSKHIGNLPLRETGGETIAAKKVVWIQHSGFSHPPPTDVSASDQVTIARGASSRKKDGRAGEGIEWG